MKHYHLVETFSALQVAQSAEFRASFFPGVQTKGRPNPNNPLYENGAMLDWGPHE